MQAAVWPEHDISLLQQDRNVSASFPVRVSSVVWSFLLCKIPLQRLYALLFGFGKVKREEGSWSEIAESVW